MKIKSKILLLAFFFSTSAFAGGSQFGLINNSFGNVLSPYSAAGMARSYEIANDDSLQLNIKNFAAWTHISKTALSINTGYNAIFGENKTESFYNENANFQGAYLGIPLIQRKLALGAGLQPFTSLEHRILNSFDTGYNNISENMYLHGGLSKVNFNLAYKLSDDYAVAIGYEYTFGTIDRQVKSVINTPVSSNIELKFQDQYSGHGYILSLLAKPTDELNVGLVIKPAIKGTITKSGDTVSDALNTAEDLNATLPTEINLGLEYSLTDIYNVGFDLVYQDWEKGFEINGKNIANYNTYYYIGLGFERLGSSRRFINYFQQIDWRAGIFYTQLAQTNNSANVHEYGFSAGLSLPIQRYQSKLDLAGFISQRGNLTNNNLKEIIIGFKFSISAKEIWFVNLED